MAVGEVTLLGLRYVVRWEVVVTEAVAVGEVGGGSQVPCD